MDNSFGHWLAGFVDGEGSFLITKFGSSGRVHCSFRIALHYKDAPILREIAERTGLGRITMQKCPSQKSAGVQWTVGRKAECLALVELFEKYPLRAKKRRDFEIWARAVRLHNEMSQGNQHTTPNDYSEMGALRRELRAGRPNRGPKMVVV
jgi:hypothetical protein